MLHFLHTHLYNRLSSLFILCSLLIPGVLSASVHPGDIAFIGMNTDGNSDEFAFVVLRDLPAGEQIKFTDAGWKVPENEFRGGESWIAWTVPGGGTSAGTVIELSMASQLSNLGDQVTAFQGTFSNPSIIAALNNAGTSWQTTSDSEHGSALPTGLADGHTAVALPHLDNIKYSGSVYGSHQQLLEDIHDPNNWSGSNTYQQNFKTWFSVSGSAPYVTIGEAITISETHGPLAIDIVSNYSGNHTATLNVIGGTATNGIDYAFATQTVSFSSGRVQTIQIPFVDDADCELTESLHLELVCNSGTDVLGDRIDIAILDNEAGSFGLEQSFENSPDDTWNFTFNPAQYNTESGTSPLYVYGQEAIWMPVITFGGEYWAPDGDKFWGIQDIDNFNGGGNFWHTIDFDAVDLTNADAASISFRYFTFNSTSQDQIQFSMMFDNGNNWTNYASLPVNTMGWRDTTVTVPQGANYIRLRFRAKENAGVLCGGIDGVKMEGIICGSNNTLTTGLVSTNYCTGGASIQVPFSTTGWFAQGNTFTAVLSDANGDFSNPIVIGTLNQSGTDPSGTILGALPGNLPAGTGYRVRVESSSPAIIGNDNGVDITLHEISLNVTGNDPTCAGNQDGNIDLTISGGTAPYFIQWTGPNNYLSTLEDPTGLAAGTYTVTVSDANGCSATASTSLAEPQFNLGLTVNDISCHGAGDGNITSNISGGQAPFNYSWTGPNGFSSNSPTLSNLLAGTYTQVVTDANGCTATDSATIDEPTPLSATATANQLSPCGDAISCYNGNDGGITLQVNGGTTPYSYQWTGPGGFSSTSANPTGLGAGAYSVVIVDANSCSTSASIFLTQPDPMDGLIDALSNNCGYILSCNGASDGTLFAVGVFGGCPPYQYQWSNGDTDSIATGLSAGTYTLTITDAGGCQIVRSATINEPPLLTANAIPQPANCDDSPDGSIDMTINGGCMPYQITWTGPNGYTSSDQNPDSLFNGSYSYTIVDNNGCSTTGTVFVNALNDVSASLGCCQDTTVCTGDSVELEILTTGVGPFEIIYLQNGDTLSMLAGTGTNYLTLSPQTATTIELISVVSLNSGCEAEACGRATIGVNACESSCSDLCVNTGVTSLVNSGSCVSVSLEVACDTLCGIDSSACPGTTVVNFNQDPAGNPLPAGTIVNNQWASLGVTFSFVNNNPNKTAVGALFDSGNPTGGDDDLGTPHADFGGPGVGPGGAAGMPGENSVALGNLLILAENTTDSNNDSLIDDPDDEGAGGELQMNFAFPYFVESLSIVDLDNGNGIIRVEQTGNRSTDFSIPGLGDNAVTTVPLLMDSVVRIRVILPGSGGISALAYCPSSPGFMDISVPCGQLSSYSNSAGLPMQVISQDSATGITGLRIFGLPSCTDSTMPPSFTVDYQVCGLESDCGSLCAPMVAYSRNGCVQYEMAGWGPVTTPDSETPDKDLPRVADQSGYIGVYPNPVQQQATVEMFLRQGGAAVAEVYDLYGNKMLRVFAGEMDAEEMETVDFEAGNWANGIYLLRLVTAEGQVYTSKFILSR